jgi:hypothetical protein
LFSVSFGKICDVLFERVFSLIGLTFFRPLVNVSREQWSAVGGRRSVTDPEKVEPSCCRYCLQPTTDHRPPTTKLKGK